MAGRHLVLVGLMGAGKTSVGQRCAELLDRPFVDTDELVVAAAGVTFEQIWSIEGESGFRARERVAVMDAAASPEPLVIACGGGAVLDADNRRVLRDSGFVVWLAASPDVLASRLVGDDSRPLLAGGDRTATLTCAKTAPADFTARLKFTTYYPFEVLVFNVTTLVRGSWWITYLFDQALWVDPTDQTRSWGVFGNAGISDGKPNPIHWSAIFGIGGSSPIPNRKLDTFGIAYYYLRFSDSFESLAPPFLRDEHGLELFYNVAVTPWFHVTADLQVITPTLELAKTSLVLGLRAKIDF
jgi:shikimate kinase